MTARESLELTGDNLPIAIDRECLAFIAMHTALEGRAPSLSEIASHLGMKTRGSAARLVTRLTRLGLIERALPWIKGGRTRALGIVLTGLAQ